MLERVWETGWEPSGDTFKSLWGGMWANPAVADFVYLGGTSFWRSTDAGKNFSRTSGLGSPSNSAHVDHHFFAAVEARELRDRRRQ